MDSQIFPYSLVEHNGGIHQTKKFVGDYDFRSEANLEYALSEVKKYDYLDKYNTRGLVSEIIARNLFDQSMNYFLRQNNAYVGNFVTGKYGWILNQKGDYISKFDRCDRILNLKKEDDFESPNFGYKTISEIDGMYMLKKLQAKKNIKTFMPFEVKSGKVDVDFDHIHNSIIEPIRYLWDSEVYFILIGFKGDLYEDVLFNKLNPKITSLHNDLSEVGSKLVPIHFPFSKDKLNAYCNVIEDSISGKNKCKAIYDKNSSKLVLIDYFGNEISGKFIPETIV